MLRSGPRSTMLFRIRDTIFFFFFLIYSQISSTFFRFSLFSSSSPPQQLLDKLSNPSLRSTSFRVRRRRPREESLRLIKKIERVLFPLVAELSSDEQTTGEVRRQRAGRTLGEFYSFGLSDGKAETRCTSRESNKPWKLGSRRGSPNLANNASKLSKGVVDRGCVKTGIEAKEKSILSSRKSKNSLFLPPPFVPSFSPSFLIPSKISRDQRYYQNSRGIPSFFFFF